MKFHLACSGGFANLRLEDHFDTAELHEDLARKVEGALTSQSLEAAHGADASPLMRDAQQYELTVLPDEDDGEVRKYRLDDSALGEEMLEVLDELRGEIVRRRRKTR